MKKILSFCLLLLLVSACTSVTPPAPSNQGQAKAAATSTAIVTQAAANTRTAAPAFSNTAAATPPALTAITATLAHCQPAPITVPTKPAVIPDNTALDKTTNLHMTGTAQEININTYRLAVTGKVDHPLNLTYDDLRCLPKVTGTYTLICPETFKDVASWSGVPLKTILEMSGVQSSANNILLKGADGYSAYVNMKQALAPDNFLAYEWEGQPLPILHGFPVRAVLPSMTGGLWVKWLVEIEVE